MLVTRSLSIPSVAPEQKRRRLVASSEFVEGADRLGREGLVEEFEDRGVALVVVDIR